MQYSLCCNNTNRYTVYLNELSLGTCHRFNNTWTIDLSFAQISFPRRYATVDEAMEAITTAWAVWSGI
jgi:hypothetical protein